VVKDGNGHKHYTAGTNVCQQASQTPPQPPTPTGDQSGGNQSNPNVGGASNQNPGPGNEVQGSTAAKPGSEVLGEQLTAPQTQGSTLPRTGLPLPALAPVGTLLVALGGLASALGRSTRA
jgi:hypothetical protein